MLDEKFAVSLFRTIFAVENVRCQSSDFRKTQHRAPPRLCQTVRDGSALSIVIPSVKRFSTAADLFDKPISLTSKNLSSDFRKTHYNRRPIKKHTTTSSITHRTFAVGSLPEATPRPTKVQPKPHPPTTPTKDQGKGRNKKSMALLI